MRAPRIAAIGVANPPRRFSQEEAFQMAGYTSLRILEIFRNCDIDFRHFYVEPGQGRNESPDQMNRRYLSGALDTGSRAVTACMHAAQTKVTDIDLPIVCTSTGYVCPDLGSRLVAQMGFRRDVRRALTLGLGCAGALPTLPRACDFVTAYPNRTALMLAVEICSACYFGYDSMDTKIGNATCADGAAAFLITDEVAERRQSPAIMDFESCIDSEHTDKVGFEHWDGKLRIILANAVGPLIITGSIYTDSSELGLIAFLNPRIPSAKPFPSSGSFFGPNRNNATARITSRCRGWSIPSIIHSLIGEDRAQCENIPATVQKAHRAKVNANRFCSIRNISPSRAV